MIESAQNYNKISEILGDSIRDDDLLVALESFISIYKEERLKKDKPGIPLSILSNRKLGVLEAVTKYMKENLSLKYSKIASLINRDERTIWAAYANAKKKNKEKFEIKEAETAIPCDIFCDRKLGPLESLVIYLKDRLHLSFNDISKQLKRNYRTIWLSYNNGIKKRK